MENIRTATSRRTFYEFRAIKLVLELGSRKSSFLISPEWIDPPWKASESHGATHLQSVIDVALQIPVLMEKVDHAHHLLESQASDEETVIQIINNLILEAENIQSNFEQWDHDLPDGSLRSAQYTPRKAGDFESSVGSSTEKVYPISFSFTNWDIASGLIYYEMSHIYLNSLLIDLEQTKQASSAPEPNTNQPNPKIQNLTRKSIQSANRICQSVEYFLEDNKLLIGRIVVLAPFEVARSVFSQLCSNGTGDWSWMHHLWRE